MVKVTENNDNYEVIEMQDMRIGVLYRVVDTEYPKYTGSVVIRYDPSVIVSLNDTNIYWSISSGVRLLVRELPSGSSITLTQE